MAGSHTTPISFPSNRGHGMSDQRVHIVTDSTCDLDPDVLQQIGVHMVPLNIHFGPETFKDRVDMLPADFYRKLESDHHHPTTSQPSPREFQTVYEKLLAEGGEIVSLQLSSKMSGTWQSAILAKKDVGSEKIHVVDSLSTSVGLGTVVYECARAAREGRSVQEVLALASHMIETSRLLFVVDTLEYLRKGGRIGMAAAFIGGLLNIKPILGLREGQVFALEKARGTRNVQNRFIALVGEYMAEHPHQEVRVAITWAGDSTNLETMLPGLNQQVDCSKALRSEIGPVVGAHVGPGTVGIALNCVPLVRRMAEPGGKPGKGYGGARAEVMRVR